MVTYSDIFLGAAWRSRAGAGHGRVLGYLLLPRTGGRQHGPSQDVYEGAAPRDEDGGAKLEPGQEGDEFIKQNHIHTRTNSYSQTHWSGIGTERTEPIATEHGQALG